MRAMDPTKRAILVAFGIYIAMPILATLGAIVFGLWLKHGA